MTETKPATQGVPRRPRPARAVEDDLFPIGNTALRRSWAAMRLLVLVFICGLVAAAVTLLAFAALIAALEGLVD